MKGHQNIVRDEQTLWNRFLEGDNEALALLFSKYFSDLFSYGMKLVPQEAMVRDLIQDLFVRFWEKRANLKQVKNVKVYMLISLKNDLLQVCRDKNNKMFDADELDNQFEISVEDIWIESEKTKALSEKIVNCLNSLTSRQREIIYLRFYLNLDFLNLSEMLGMNVQSVRNLLFRALEKIRSEIESDDIELSNVEVFLFMLFSKNRMNSSPR